MPKLKLYPSQQVVELNTQESVLQQLLKKDILLKSSCGGFASCGDCVVKIRSGENACASPTYEEIKLLGNVFHLTKERLTCQLRIEGDVEIDISAHEKWRKNVRSKPAIATKNENTVRRRKPQVKAEEVDMEKNEVLTPTKTETVKPEKQGGFNRPKRKF